MATESFPDIFIDEDPQKALEELNEALQGDSDNAQWFCQRAYAHILLKNYSCAVDDAKKAQQLKPSLPLAFMRTGIAEYHLKLFESAHAAFTQGHQLDGKYTSHHPTQYQTLFATISCLFHCPL
ncbi:suppressor of G2 allele of SKP1 homolog isoform X2 [Notothenia coriiceps]|uniref:Suppressor of G2 allele of SKP1 homolog isoform X2 n=1 Tax=Notothenia coriiceps TaxID=8208 RepID=A0A6I9Q6M6_9TELE|nr:PREDICTED: suppressor of G2 allele of SKP1 homolog isoform X2 [Notothenia coriiceps]